MRIGVDARNLVPSLSGIGRYVVETSRHLARLGADIRLYLPAMPPHGLPEIEGVTFEVASFRSAPARAYWGQRVLPRWADRDRVDVLWGPAHRLPRHRPGDIAKVLTVLDFVWRHAPETMHLRTRIGEHLFMRSSAKSADLIVAISQATADDFHNHFPKLKTPVRVVHPGRTDFTEPSDSRAILARYGLGHRPYALFVGTLEPRKNLPKLLEAYASLSPEIRGVCMIAIAGAQGWGREDLDRRIAALGLSPDVVRTGYVGTSELAALYANASFLVMPSLYEGFGLPIVEANGFGVPALTSNLSCMPEVGGKSAYLVDPNDQACLAEGFARLAIDEETRSDLATHARANAARFEWNASARSILAAFEEALRIRAGRVG